MRNFLRRLRYWFSHSRNEKELAEEIDFHRSLKQQELERTGLPSAEAATASRRAMGNTLFAIEHARSVWISLWLEQAGQDLRYAARSLLRTPSFTLAAMLTIALGVGANTGVFSVFNAVLLKLLPVEDPKQLVFVERSGPSAPPGSAPYPCLARLPAETHLFSGLSAFATDELRIEIDGIPEPVMGQVASGNYFELLGVKPALGRLMEAGDEQLDPAIAIISDGYWRRRFGGSPAVIGKTISYRNQNFVIAGVTSPEFSGLAPGRPVDVTIPITTSRDQLETSPAWWFSAIGRLEQGVSKDQAEAGTAVVFQSCMSAGQPAIGPKSPMIQQLRLTPAALGTDALRRRFSDPLYVLMGIVVLVLVLATANTANLLLTRGIARRREFAIRLATGAGRARLVRQLFTEVLLLFGLSALPGVLCAGFAVRAIETLFAQGRRPLTLEANFNWLVLAFSITITMVAGLLAGLFPAWRASRTDPHQAIKEGAARTGDSGGYGMLRGLVAFQVALSLVLLVGAVTFAQTLANLHDVNPGMQNEEVLTMSVELPEGYAQAGKSTESWNGVLEGVRQIPGVRLAGVSTFTPMSGRDPGPTPVRVAGIQDPTEPASLRVNQVSEGYFETLGVWLLRGRLLTNRDAEGSPKVALINESAARKYFSNRDPIGESVEFFSGGTVDSAYRIIGVVADTKHLNLREPSPPFAFIPTRQPRNAERRVTLSVAAVQPNGHTALVQPIRNRLRSVDPGLMISEVITIRQQLESTLLSERLLSTLSGVFGVLALTLATIGLYGVLSYRVGQQGRAIGIRLALGASSSSVAFSVVRQCGLMVGAGLVCGLPFAFLLARAADSMLREVNSNDPRIYFVSVAALCLAGFASAYLPARRASAVEPAEALRHS